MCKSEYYFLSVNIIFNEILEAKVWDSDGKMFPSDLPQTEGTKCSPHIRRKLNKQNVPLRSDHNSRNKMFPSDPTQTQGTKIFTSNTTLYKMYSHMYITSIIIKSLKYVAITWWSFILRKQSFSV